MHLAAVRLAGILAIVLGIMLGLYFLDVIVIAGSILLAGSIFLGKVLVVALLIVSGFFFLSDDAKQMAAEWKRDAAIKKAVHRVPEDPALVAAKQEVDSILQSDI